MSMRRAIVQFGLSLFTVASICASATAQCQHDWFPETPAGADSNISCLAEFNGDLYAGGSFQNIGGVSASSVAQRDATGWRALGSGVVNGQYPGLVIALQSYKGDLIAGGTFNFAGGFPVANIARWNGDEWTELAAGLDSQCLALARFGDDLIAAGWFLHANGQPAAHVARWNGVEWSALGAGLNSAPLALTIFNGKLIAGGYFSQGVARWNGSDWEPLGQFPGSSAASFAVYQDQLFVGELSGLDFFTHVYRWDDPNWTEVGEFSDTTDDYGVYALAVYNDELVASSDASNLEGDQVNHIASWNGTSWSPLGQGLNGSASALLAFGDDLIAAGDFTQAGGHTSAHIASWKPILPTINTQPTRRNVVQGQSAEFSIAATHATSYQWRHNQQILTDNAHITGATTPTLTINHVSLADGGNYDCVLTNDCSSTTTNPAALRVIATVPGKPITAQPAQPNPG